MTWSSPPGTGRLRPEWIDSLLMVPQRGRVEEVESWPVSNSIPRYTATPKIFHRKE
jgi:hypothetical protein